MIEKKTNSMNSNNQNKQNLKSNIRKNKKIFLNEPIDFGKFNF